jgi:hypothetical protein
MKFYEMAIGKRAVQGGCATKTGSFCWLGDAVLKPSVYDTLGYEGGLMPEPLATLEQKRTSLLLRISALGDFRPGSITGTGGRCGNRNCHCHRPNDPGHAPHPRLTYKLDGKSVTESFPTPAAQRKAEAEIETFRTYQELSRSFVLVNEQICRARPVEETLTPEEKKRRKRSSKK